MITRSTRTTSTIGVTLIPTIAPRPPRPPVCVTPAMCVLPSLRRRDGRERVVVEGGLVPLHLGRVDRAAHRRARASLARLEKRGEQLAERDRVGLDLADALLRDVVGHHRGER